MNRLILPGMMLLSLSSTAALGLTAGQVERICADFTGDCADHPLLNAYVGGALDMVAVLDERAGLASRLYCGRAEDVFDVPAIIRYLQAHASEERESNAMLLVVRYLTDNGGCQ